MQPGHFAKWRFHGSRNRHVTYSTKKKLRCVFFPALLGAGKIFTDAEFRSAGQRYAHRGSESVPRHLPEHYASRSSWPSNVPELLGVNGGLFGGNLGCPGLMWKITSKKVMKTWRQLLRFFLNKKYVEVFAEVPHHLRRIPRQKIYSLLWLWFSGKWL